MEIIQFFIVSILKKIYKKTFMDIHGMILKQLKGHSGCKVLLCENNKKFVRKISSKKSYNERRQSR